MILVGALLPPAAAQIMAISALMCATVCACFSLCVYVCVCVMMATKDIFNPKGQIQSFERPPSEKWNVSLCKVYKICIGSSHFSYLDINAGDFTTISAPLLKAEFVSFTSRAHMFCELKEPFPLFGQRHANVAHTWHFRLGTFSSLLVGLPLNNNKKCYMSYSVYVEFLIYMII